VDDSDAFSTRITKAQKYEYWTHLLQNRGTRRPLPKAFKSWKSREIAKVNEQANYLPGHIRTFNFISTARWDQRSLNLFIIFLLLTVFYADGYALSISPKLITMNSMNQIIALPLFLMFLCQLVPFFGMLYFITHRNDLVHFKAVKEIGTWVSPAAPACFCAACICSTLYAVLGMSRIAPLPVLHRYASYTPPTPLS
jgi:hypothetical protein